MKTKKKKPKDFVGLVCICMIVVDGCNMHVCVQVHIALIGVPQNYKRLCKIRDRRIFHLLHRIKEKHTETASNLFYFHEHLNNE